MVDMESRWLIDFNQRVERARQACLALYLDEPSVSAAELLVTFERTVDRLRYTEAQKEAQKKES